METTQNWLSTKQLRDQQRNKPSEILSYEDSMIMITIGWVFLSGGFCLFGIVANAINLIIYTKLGLDTTMNISLCALAVSDLLSLVTLQVAGIFLNPLFMNADISMYSADVQYLICGWPHACFGHITCWITAYITAERCLCIAFPLKIKQILTPKRTAILISIMYLINMASSIPEYNSVYIDWKFAPERNKSVLALAYRENREEMKITGFIVLAVLGAISFPAVIIFTAILIVKLKQQTTWRKNIQQTEAFTKRDIKTMHMVVLIAIILIVCYTPGVMISLATCLVPEFEIAGLQVNLYRGLWGFVFVFEAINSSVNIFLYYKMSTKFRNSFDVMFQACKLNRSNSETPIVGTPYKNEL